jgi:GntR family transcriptional regulator, transcriptional repressor for pyruvate dehydrogenase complex
MTGDMAKATTSEATAVPLVLQVVTQLRESIVNRTYKQGDKLPPEGRMAETFGVSRNVIREAMRTLAGQGLVEVAQGRPARVCSPDPEILSGALNLLLQGNAKSSLLKLLEVRRALETEIATIAARERTKQNCERMRLAIDTLANVESIPDRVAADIAFHMELAGATQNPLFPILLSAVLPLFSEFISKVTVGDGSQRASATHARILDAVERSDSERARREVLNHLDIAEGDLRKNVVDNMS